MLHRLHACLEIVAARLELLFGLARDNQLLDEQVLVTLEGVELRFDPILAELEDGAVVRLQ